MLRIPHCLDNRLTDGGKFVSPKHRPHFNHKKHYFSVSGSHICERLSKPQGLMRPEGLSKFKNSPHLVSNQGSRRHNALTITLPFAPLKI
jgi:hypothetical protein